MFAVTERLLLRPGWLEDAPALAAAIADHAIVSKLETAPWPYRQSDAEAHLSAGRDPRYPNFMLFARTLGAPRLVGAAGIRRNADGDAELGYWIARPFWGLGYATEGGQAIVRMARESLRLPRLVSGHFVDNPASGRVLAKLGFRPTGAIAMRHSRAREGAVPCRLYELSDEEGAMSPALAA